MFIFIQLLPFPSSPQKSNDIELSVVFVHHPFSFHIGLSVDDILFD